MNFPFKKLPKGNLLLYISFTAISLCFLLVVSTMRAEKYNDMSKRQFYTRHSESFAIVDSDNENQWDEVIPELEKRYNDFAVYVPLTSNEFPVKGIYVKGKVISPPMLSGNFFDSSTSWTDEPKMVLGKDNEKDTFLQNEKMYYRYDGTDYQVIGIMGTKTESKLNSMCFVDFKSAVKTMGINTSYVLDTKRKSYLYDVAGSISFLFRSPASAMINTMEYGTPPSFAEEMFSSDNIMDTLYIMILVSFSLSTVIVTFIWLSQRNQLFFACKLFGYRERMMLWEISKRFYPVTGISFLIGLILVCIISANVSVINILPEDIISALLLTIGLGTIILSGCYTYKRFSKKI